MKNLLIRFHCWYYSHILANSYIGFGKTYKETWYCWSCSYPYPYKDDEFKNTKISQEYSSVIFYD